MNHNLVKVVLLSSFVLEMNKTIQHIIILSILMLLNSGKLFSHTVFIGVNQNNITQNIAVTPGIYDIYKFKNIVKGPVTEVNKKRTLLHDEEEEEEVHGIVLKKCIEKSSCISSIYTLNTFSPYSQKNRSLPFCDDIITIHPYNSLYLFFGVLRI